MKEFIPTPERTEILEALSTAQRELQLAAALLGGGSHPRGHKILNFAQNVLDVTSLLVLDWRDEDESIESRRK